MALMKDNLLKSNDGFFTYIRPRTDAVQEVTVSTSNPGAESSAEGAVQIKFVTQGGTNEYHGGGYWYHRNPALNANYWFNNRDLAADPVTHKAPQQRILLNQFGVKVGGPISVPKVFSGKDRLFFFVNYEEYRLPERSVQRTRNLPTEDAINGIYKFTTTSQTYAPPAGVTCTTGATRTCSVNVLTMAGAAGLTPDRKSTRLNSSHLGISYAVFCLKKKKQNTAVGWLIVFDTNRLTLHRMERAADVADAALTCAQYLDRAVTAASAVAAKYSHAVGS